MAVSHCFVIARHTKSGTPHPGKQNILSWLPWILQQVRFSIKRIVDIGTGFGIEIFIDWAVGTKPKQWARIIFGGLCFLNKFLVFQFGEVFLHFPLVFFHFPNFLLAFLSFCLSFQWFSLHFLNFLLVFLSISAHFPCFSISVPSCPNFILYMFLTFSVHCPFISFILVFLCLFFHQCSFMFLSFSLLSLFFH